MKPLSNKFAKFCEYFMQAFTAQRGQALTRGLAQREPIVLTQGTGLCLSADSVTAAITALLEIAQPSAAPVRRDITVHMEIHLHNHS